MQIKKFLNVHNDEYSKWLVDNHFGGIEYKILKYLQDIDKGTFIEAGAHDGLFQSTTKILEDLGWTGLLIEPSVSLYNQCAKNRTSICENYALVSSEYEDGEIMGSINTSLISNKMGITLMGSGDETCKTTTLTKLCEKHNMYDFDLFSLDVEGYEMEVLNGIDFDKINIKYFLIECHTIHYSFEELIQYMNDKGYDVVCNLSNFNLNNCPTWPGTHQDYLFIKG